MAQIDEFNAGRMPLTNVARGNDNSLTMTQDKWNDAVGREMLTPQSVLDPLGFSPDQSANGTAGEASNWQPGFGVIGTGNGMSSENLDENADLRFRGGDPDAELD